MVFKAQLRVFELIATDASGCSAPSWGRVAIAGQRSWRTWGAHAWKVLPKMFAANLAKYIKKASFTTCAAGMQTASQLWCLDGMDVRPKRAFSILSPNFLAKNEQLQN